MVSREEDMGLKILLMAFGLSAFGAATSSADVIYNYTGNLFTDTFANGSPPITYNTTSDRVTGSFVVPGVLPANSY